MEGNTEYKSNEVLFATFILDEIEFGINANNVNEAIRPTQEIIPIPSSIDIIDGIINLRNKVIPIINMRKRFGLNNKPETSRYYAIVNYKNHEIGLCFDDICKVIRVPKDNIKDMGKSAEDNQFCSSGIISIDNGKNLVQILDPQLVFQNLCLPLIDNIQDKNAIKHIPMEKDIVFELNSITYTISADQIQEIMKIPKIYKRIDIEKYIKGFIAIRNELYTLIDLDMYFNLKPQEITEDSRVIILKNISSCALLVSSIKEVIQYESEKILNIPMFNISRLQDSFAGIVPLRGKDLIKLNAKKLFPENVKKRIESNAAIHQKEAVLEKLKTKEKFEKDENTRVLITFKLGEIYGIDINKFKEIIKYTAANISCLPGSKDYFAGILNLRNMTIPVVNLRKLYDLLDYENIEETRIIILNYNDNLFAIIVDEIIEIITCSNAEVVNLSTFIVSQFSEKIKNHIEAAFRLKDSNDNEKKVLMLNLDNFIETITLEEVTSIQVPN